MSRYIKLVDAIAAIHNYWQQTCYQNESAETRERDKGFCNGLLVANKILRAIPTTDMAERKRGEWRENTFCSNCGWFGEDEDGDIVMSFYNFCPNCGASMREREGE